MIAALANMARSYQTLVGSGLVYEQVPPGLAQQAIIEAVRQLLEEFRELEREHLGYTTLKDAEVLKALVLVLRLAHIHTSGRPRSRGFLDFLHRTISRCAILNRRRGRAGQPDHHAVAQATYVTDAPARHFLFARG